MLKSRGGAFHYISNGVDKVPILKVFKPIIVVSVPILLCFTLGLGARANTLESNSFLDVSYPYAASDMEIKEVMSEFAQRTLLPVSVSDALSGLVEVRNSSGTIGSFLNQIASKVQAVWWHDGIVLHLEPANSISSIYVDISDMPIDELKSQIDEFGLGWDAFPIRISADGSLARVAGPESYVTQVKEVIERLVEMRRNRPERVRRALQPRLYLGGRTLTAQSRDAERDARANEE